MALVTVRNLSFALLCLALISCFHASKRLEFSQLKIVIDSSANFYLDTIGVSTKYNNYTIQYREYDSSLGQLVYVLGKIEKGKAKLQLQSFLDRTFTKEIQIEENTTIFIKASELNNFQNAQQKTMPSFDLKDGDTIVIGLQSRGCFHFYKENVIVSISDGKYNVAFNNTRPQGYGLGNMNIKRQFGLEFKDTLDIFSAECRKLLKRGQDCFSTTTANIFIRQGNLVYEFPDFGCKDWEGYNRLVVALDPPWPKIVE